MEFSQSSSPAPAVGGTAPQHLVINPLWDTAALNAPQSFRDGVTTAIAILEAAFVDPITVNIAIGYGEWAGVTLANQSISEGTIGYQSYGQTPDGYITPVSSGGGVTETYANLTSKLAASASSADDLKSLVSLPGDSSTPDGAALNQENFAIGMAQGKALGVVINPNLNDIDGQIAMGTAFTGATLIAGAIHEITHAMGRIAGGYALDLFRYASDHTHDLAPKSSPSPSSPDAPAFFSIDGGVTDLGDFGRTSDPGDFLNPPGQTVSGEVGSSTVTPDDPFNEAVGIPTGSSTDNSKYLTAVDLTEMDVLGFRRASELSASGTVTLDRPSYFNASPLQAKFSLVNNGAGTSYASTASLYLSTTPTITAADIASGAATLIGSAATPALAGGATQSFTADCTLPTYLAPGTYYVTAVADSGQALVDSNLADNISGATALIVAPSAYVFVSRAGNQPLEWNGDLKTYDDKGNLISQQFNWNYGDQALVGLFPNDPLPTTDTDVQIGPSGGALTYQITLSQRDEYGNRAYARNLSIATGSSLTMLAGDQGPGNSNVVSALTVNGSIHNQGHIDVQTSAYHGSGILLRTATTLDGGGGVNFGDIEFYSNSGFFNESGHDSSLTNVDNTITGSGQISNITDLAFGPDLGPTGTLAFANEAIVNANASRSFTIDAGSASIAVVNTGLFESTSTGGLYIRTPTLDNRGGRVFADDGAQVVLNSTRLVGGHLQSNGSGAIVIADSNVVLDGTQTNGAITSDANLVVNNGVYAVARGGLTNNGTLSVKTAAYSGAAFEIDGDYTLSGTGAVRLKASGYGDSVLTNVAGQNDALTNLSNAIAGSGTIGGNGGGGSLTFINKGSVVADDPDSPLVITAHTVQNYGAITATGAGGLQLSGVTLTNSPTGMVQAQDGSHVDVTSTTISGNLAASGTGVINAQYGSVFDDVDLAGTVKVADQILTIKNAFTENGIVQLSAGSYSGASVQVSGSATWSGNGSIDSSATGLYSGCSLSNVYNQDATLSNTGTLTLSGVYGSIAANSGSFVVTNSGTINITGAFSITLGSGASTLINTGLLETSGSGALSIVSSAVKNQGGVISALGNSHIDLTQNAVILGGTLKTLNGGLINANGYGNQFDGLTSGAITSEANVSVGGGYALALQGGYVNKSTLAIANGAVAISASGATLSGGGAVTLNASSGGASISGASSALHNVDNVISGFGTIESGVLLDNQTAGVINANVSGQTLSIDATAGVANSGLMEATNGGTLSLSQGSVANAGGLISAAGGTVELRSVYINQGTVRSSAGGGVHVRDSGVVLNASNVVNGVTVNGNFYVDPGLTLTMTGAFANKGVITVGAPSGAASIAIAGSLSGGGRVVLATGVANTISGGLTNIDNTILGNGVINAVIQQGAAGVISTTGSLRLDTKHAIANDGKIEALGGSLVINDAVTGAGSAIVSNNATLELDGAFAQQVTFQGAGLLALANSAAFSGALSGFGLGDEVRFDNVSFAAGDTVAFVRDGSKRSGHVSVRNATGAEIAAFAVNGLYSSSQFSVVNDAGGVAIMGVSGHARLPSLDLNADGTSDIVWKNTAGGAAYEWQMGAGQNQSSVYLGALGGWTLAGAGDFNADGTADLMWQNTLSGEVYEWVMGAGQRQGSIDVGNLAGWNLVGHGDFNGDSAADVMWQNKSSGEVYEWLMSGGQRSSSVDVGNLKGWALVGNGDYNGDGVSDVIWQNTATGDVYEWLMSSGQRQSSVHVGSLAGWSLVGSGDFDGNGTSDMLWKNNTTGQIYEWQTDTTGARSNSVDLGIQKGYDVAAVGDYAGTGVSEVVWQGKAGGDIWLWSMENGQHSGSTYLGSAPGWTAT